MTETPPLRRIRYARVSTYGQTLDAQLDQLRADGCTRLYRETASGARADGAQFRSLAEPWADTGTSTGRLMIAVLGGLADVERDLIRTRTAEGRSRAKGRGQHMGPK
jgi:DNA invertase Pin-like site-specific DNA recombinase